MKMMVDSTSVTLIGSKFSEGGFIETPALVTGEIRAPLRETLPFWFAMTSPVVGVVVGLFLAWLLGGY
jgi:hypothetical protein